VDFTGRGDEPRRDLRLLCQPKHRGGQQLGRSGRHEKPASPDFDRFRHAVDSLVDGPNMRVVAGPRFI
jgi:hypothetical protein